MSRVSKQPNWGLIEGIVLDAVGTLIKPVPSVAEAYTTAAFRQGVELNRDDVRARFHLHFQDDEIRGDQGVFSTSEAVERSRWRRIVAKVLPEVPNKERVFDELWDHFGDPLSWHCFSDVVPALQALRDKGIRVGVGSNFDCRLRQVVQGLPELAPWVETLVISSEVGFRKPHPSFYLTACEALGLPAHKVLWVGDDLENDVRGPIRAGLSGVFLDRNLDRPPELPHVSNLTALLESTLPGA
jgi:putative hydrolase of the HAD superfamily